MIEKIKIRSSSIWTDAIYVCSNGHERNFVKLRRIVDKPEVSYSWGREKWSVLLKTSHYNKHLLKLLGMKRG